MMDQTQERAIARGLQEGSVEAWHALYDAFSAPLWQAVARLLGPESTDVADVVQETFLAAARSAKGFDPSRGSLWLWLTGIARRQVALHYRKASRQERVKEAAERMGTSSEQVLRWIDDRHPSPPEALATAEMAVLVRAALAELPHDYEDLLTARYLDDVPVEDLAGVHRSTASAIRSKLARARRAFRDLFAKLCPVSPGDPARGAP
jgi:RNA polymerase sigma-70 factor (ECF subfamily)